MHRLSEADEGNFRLILELHREIDPAREYSRPARVSAPREQGDFLTYRSSKATFPPAGRKNIIEIIPRDRILRGLWDVFDTSFLFLTSKSRRNFVRSVLLSLARDTLVECRTASLRHLQGQRRIVIRLCVRNDSPSPYVKIAIRPQTQIRPVYLRGSHYIVVQ